MLLFKFIRKHGKVIPIPADGKSAEGFRRIKELAKIAKSSKSVYAIDNAKKRIKEMLAEARSV